VLHSTPLPAALDGLVADGVGAVSSPSEAVPVGGA
jgi:hypothetical protein